MSENWSSVSCVLGLSWFRLAGLVVSLRFAGRSESESCCWWFEVAARGADTTRLAALLVSLFDEALLVLFLRDGPSVSKSCSENERRGRASFGVGSVDGIGWAERSSADVDILRPGFPSVRDSRPNAEGGLLPKKTLSSSYSGKSSTSNVDVTTDFAVMRVG